MSCGRTRSLLSGIPFFAQHRHENGVVVATLTEDILSQEALLLEPNLFVGANATRVVLKHVKPDSIQVQALKAVLNHEVSRLGAVAFGPFRLVSYGNAKTCMAILEVHAMQTRGADESVAGLDDNPEDKVMLALRRLGDEF